MSSILIKRAALPFIGDAFIQHFKEIPLDIIDLLRPRGPITGRAIHLAIERQKADYCKRRSIEISKIIKKNDYDPVFAIGIIKQADDNEFLGRLLGFVAEGLLGYQDTPRSAPNGRAKPLRHSLWSSLL